MNERIKTYLREEQENIHTLASQIFGYAELADAEVESAQALVRFLEEAHFQVELGVGGIPTAIRGVKGSGNPVIGFLGEYDALPNLNQKGGVPYRCGDATQSGHGCGHNLLGAGAAAAAAALAEAMEQEGKSGTVVYYGCPAEEILKGKIQMIQAGCFRDLDVAITWHPGLENRCGEIAFTAMDSVQFFFHGTSSHASGSPEQGRSALDACELMNVGVNYLREHVSDDVRMHYAHLPNTMKPNVVPAEAGVWYFIRARARETVDDAISRVQDIARGAALMTSTEVDWKFLSRGYGTLVNFSLCRVAHDAMVALGHPGFTDQEKAFAAQISENSGSTREMGVLDETLDVPSGTLLYKAGSTDVSDVSQLLPTLNIRTTCGPQNVALHSWQFASCADSSVGRKGMMFAAGIMAQTGWKLLTEPNLLEEAKAEFAANAKGYVPLPDT